MVGWYATRQATAVAYWAVVVVAGAGATIMVESDDMVDIVSVVMGAAISVVAGSVVVVSAGFDSHEVRPAATTKARAAIFSVFFMGKVVLVCGSVKTSFIQE